MCGICGIIYSEYTGYFNRNILEKMTRTMAHRGPDGEGFYINRSVGLGHRRLSIIDVSSGHQPMSNEDATIWITFNGEIYNYLELREYLIKKGHLFRTISDTETIIHAYEEFGEKCLEKLRGMFAFAIWDQKNQKLFAARDRIGKKPFYYTKIDEAFIFSSEIKSILQYPLCKREVDKLSLDLYLTLRYVPGPLTMFKGIKKLQPGTYLIFKNGNLSIHEYWDISNAYEIEYSKRNDYYDNFLTLLEESIRIRLMSEVPLGVFLSGGIDSSLVVAVLSKMVDKPIKTFSVGYEKDYGVNEFNFARMVSKRYNTEHHELCIKSSDFYDFIPRLVWYLDEPIADPATIPLFFLSEFAKEWITVVLSGEGADEILAGYYIYKKMLWLNKFQYMPKIIWESLLIGIFKKFFYKQKWQKYLELAKLPLEKRYYGVSNSFSLKSKKAIFPFSKDFDGELENLFRDYYKRVETWNDLNKMLYVDLKVWLPDDLLMKADKMTMATSMELRVPFLDHKLIEFAFSLPVNLKINGNTTKHLLREIGKELLPPPIIYREKKGFPVPISQWFKGDLNQVAQETLLQSKSACRDYFEIDSIKLILKNQAMGQDDSSEQIWNLLVFEFWHKVFMQSTQISPSVK